MKLQNAIKACEKAGGINKGDDRFFSFAFPGSRCRVEFIRNGSADEAVCIGVRHEADHSDPMADYCAKIYTSSLKRAIALGVTA